MQIEKEGKTIAYYNAEGMEFRKGKTWNWLGSGWENLNILIHRGKSIEFHGEFKGHKFFKDFSGSEIP